ncbi:type IV pilus twitching motility protein PilT [Tepidimicrobium xylanilyticum]|uniref:Twitching motility protein PilT n=1 Tax=Tepidimicrobium xylanilyticum TaxID=1123352 RepID=A0A1H3CPQ2_9FIRM|nr:type IV pilus twitching motility protein PilT [Tepidimicrobium xylanilyticum]GMG97691.1 twitching motility protein [Tepidimicrobium xylanilyticum]SDX55544.1 twitching motility protein PilT [Tepidimicrobium xylanilyticum]
MDLLELIRFGVNEGASDIHLTVGIPPSMRVHGSLVHLNERSLDSEDIENLIRQILSNKELKELEQKGHIDISYSSQGIGHFRINAYKQRNSYAMAIRVIPLEVPTIDELGLPAIVKNITRFPRGLILVTGPAGCGKSTTLASMINLINEERNCHIITLEDPIEFLHTHKKSIVNQREIGRDTCSFSNALSAALRQDPDVIMVGEMRDLNTISIVLTAAETGHLILSTLHTIGAAKTIDRIIDVFPPYQQKQIRVQLSSVIQAIISQQLLPRTEGGRRVVASEIMIATHAIRNLIREEKTYQIDTIIQTSKQQGMQTMDDCLLDFYRRGVISRETLIRQAMDMDYVRKYII